MQRRLLSIITTWPFLLSLALLLMNDRWLKGAYPGVITGKLSDFAGIAVVSLLLLAAYPQRGFSIFFGVGFAFLWWKSPASEPFLRSFNDLGLFRIGRTVDYTDMIALIVFPACHAVVAQVPKYSIHWPRVRRYMAIPTVAITITAILGTSQRPTLQDYVVRTVSVSEELQREEIVEVINTVATSHGLVYDKRPYPADATMLSGNGMTMTYSFPSKNVVAFRVLAYSDGIIAFPWSTSGDEKADALRCALKKELAVRFKGLEYIEPLVR